MSDEFSPDLQSTGQAGFVWKSPSGPVYRLKLRQNGSIVARVGESLDPIDVRDLPRDMLQELKDYVELRLDQQWAQNARTRLRQIRLRGDPE